MFRSLAAIVLTACGGSGLCEGTGGIIDECYEGWTQAECDDWDAEEVNGSDWVWHSSGSCEGYGYVVECEDVWVTSSEDCALGTYSSTY
jgi:hypothetical protein